MITLYLLLPSSHHHDHPPGGSSVSVVALSAGCVGGVILAIGAGLAYFYGVKKGGKKDLKQYPSIHSESNSSLNGEVYFGCVLSASTADLTPPTKTHAASLYDMIPGSKAEDIQASV